MKQEEMIKNKAKEYAYKNYEQGGDSDTWEDIYTDGAEYGYQLAVENACDWWIEELSYPSMTQEELRWCKNKVNAFKKAMKGGNPYKT